MPDHPNAKNTAETGVPKSSAMSRLSEKERKALELQDKAEHQTGSSREALQRAATRKIA